MTIDILLATYNGEKYLREQIDSILAQTERDWRIVARDDGSSDGTIKILNEYQRELGPDKMIILDGVKPQEHPPGLTHRQVVQRVMANFSALMEYSRDHVPPAGYAMFCDQDDKWHSDKIEKTMAKMKQLESEYGSHGPLLVHTDMRMVDPEGKTIDESYKSSRKPEKQNIRWALTRGSAHGCTVMMNRRLLEIATPVSDRALMHDTWAEIIAIAAGHVGYLKEATIDYRKHGSNVTIHPVAMSTKPHDVLKRKINSAKKRLDEGLVYNVPQAIAVREHAGRYMTAEALHDIDRFIEISAIESPLHRGVSLMAKGYLERCSPHTVNGFGAIRMRDEPHQDSRNR